MTRGARYLLATAASAAALVAALAASGAFQPKPDSVAAEPPCDTCTARHKAKLRLRKRLTAPDAASE